MVGKVTSKPWHMAKNPVQPSIADMPTSAKSKCQIRHISDNNVVTL